jgi:transcriptional regulator with XRE-family HTH domain
MPSALGDKIRAARKALKLSLEDLAEKVSSSKSYMWELENRDEPNPGADLLMRIAKIMKPFPNTFVYPGVTANTATWFIGYQQYHVRSTLALLAMPTYVAPEDWPAAL